MDPLVYVIVLNFNGGKWIDACFKALLATDYSNFTAVFVDNASEDESVNLIQSFPEVEIIANKTNCGFVMGNNPAISSALEAGADYVVLLNPDTKVEPTWLRELISVGESESRIGILGAVQLRYENDEFNSWTLSNARAHLAELRDLQTAPGWISVGWVEGSCFAVKRRVFERVGLLDPIYHTFYEELDFCRRAICSGFEVALVPRSRYHHYRGGSWKANARIKRERTYRYDRGHLIYRLTDPKKSFLGNFFCYCLSVGSKAVEALKHFRVYRLWDLIRVQFAIAVLFKPLAKKWKRDQSLLSSRGSEKEQLVSGELRRT